MLSGLFVYECDAQLSYIYTSVGALINVQGKSQNPD